MLNNKNIIIYIAISLFNLFVVNTLLIFSNNFSSYFFINTTITSLLIFILFTIFSLVIFVILKRVIGLKILGYLSLLFLFFSIGSSIHSNNLSFIFINNLKLTLIIKFFIINVITILVLYLSLKKFLNFFLIFYLISSTFIIFKNSIQILKENEIKINEEVLLSRNLNVFILGFDGVNNDEIIKIISDGKYSSEFNNFTFFDNFYTNSPSSKASISFELIGNRAGEITNYTNKNIINFVKSDKDNFINRTDIHKNILSYYRLFTDQERLIDFSTIKLINIFLLINEKYIRESLVRSFTYKVNGFVPSQVALGNYSSNISLNQYEAYINNLNQSKIIDKPVMHSGFWMFPHYPVNFDANCNKLKMDEVKTSQNIVGQYKLTECVVNKMIQFIKTIKNLGVYDHSIIIFKSDHGSTTKIFDDNDIRKLSIKNSSYGYGRYLPFLLIKDSSVKNFSINNSVIMNKDIGAYVCSLFQSNIEKCEKYGLNYIQDALGGKSIDRREEIFFIDEGQNTHIIDFLTPIKVKLTNNKDDINLENIFYIE